MNIFETHSRIVSDYASYISSFIKISDKEIEARVQDELGQGKLWPEPLLQFNRSFEIVGNIDQIAGAEGLHHDIPHIFSSYRLYRHQIEAMRLGIAGKDFVVTSGTGMHKELDEAARDAYGWQDLKLDHDFYEVETLPENDRVRFTISPTARKEVLRRLLALNHERAKAEQAAEAAQVAAAPKKTTRKRRSSKDGKSSGLFRQDDMTVLEGEADA